jgi:hypothetical protein
VLAGTYYGGIFTSSNYGTNWTQYGTNSGLLSNGATKIVVNGISTYIINGHEVAVSTNNGNTWTSISKGLPSYDGAGNFDLNDLVVSGTTLYAAFSSYSFDSLGGVYISTDNGANWTRKVSGLTSTKINSLVIKGNTILAGTEDKGIFITTNGGNNWLEANTGITNGRTNKIMYNSFSYFASVDGSLYRSVNGTDWTHVTYGGGGSYVRARDFDIVNSMIVTFDQYTSSSFEFYISLDNANNWTRNYASTTNYFRKILIAGTKILGCGENGVSEIANNGNTVVELNNGLTADYISNPTVIGSNIYGNMGNFSYTSSDNGNTWNKLGDRFYRFYSFNNTLYGIIESAYGYSTNNGASFTTVKPFPDTVYNYINDMAVNGNNVYLATDTGVYYSGNNGSTWEKRSNGVDTRVSSIFYKDNNLFASTNNGFFISTNNAINWTKVNGEIGNAIIGRVKANGSTLYAFTYFDTKIKGPFVSINNGTSWTKMSVVDTLIFDIAFNGSNLYVADFMTGISSSNNNGAFWAKKNEGLIPNVFGGFNFYATEDIFIANNYIFTYVGGDNRGLYKRPLSEVTAINEVSSTTTNIYPNPTSGIIYIATIQALETIRVFDVSGKLVQTLTNPNKLTSVELDLSGLDNGIYFIHAQTENGKVSKSKLVVSK